MSDGIVGAVGLILLLVLPAFSSSSRCSVVGENLVGVEGADAGAGAVPPNAVERHRIQLLEGLREGLCLGLCVDRLKM